MQASRAAGNYNIHFLLVSNFPRSLARMKPLLIKTLIVSCLMGLVAVGFAQQEKKKKGGGNDPTAKLRKSVADSDLGADLKEKVVKVIDEHAGKLKELQAKVDATLTDDQRAAKKAAQKAAKDAGRKGKAAQEEAFAAMKLTDEQKKKYDEANSALQAGTADMNKAVAALLTDDQAQDLGVKKKRKNN
jgi:Skp family chaperone for outer membrane proteins